MSSRRHVVSTERPFVLDCRSILRSRRAFERSRRDFLFARRDGVRTNRHDDRGHRDVRRSRRDGVDTRWSGNRRRRTFPSWCRADLSPRSHGERAERHALRSRSHGREHEGPFAADEGPFGAHEGPMVDRQRRTGVRSRAHSSWAVSRARRAPTASRRRGPSLHRNLAPPVRARHAVAAAGADGAELAEARAPAVGQAAPRRRWQAAPSVGQSAAVTRPAAATAGVAHPVQAVVTGAAVGVVGAGAAGRDARYG